jgi:RNA polymerase sigma-B factor
MPGRPLPAAPAAPATSAVPPTAGPLDVELTVQHPDRATLALRGEIDLWTAPRAADAVTDAGRRFRELTVDLRGIDFIDPRGIRALTAAIGEVRAAGTGLRLDPGPAVRRLLDLLDPAHEPGARRSVEYDHLMPLFTELADAGLDEARRADVRQRLITGYLPVARNIARKYRHRGENLDDLEQVATIGLIHAVDRFDPGYGVNFLTFATPTIEGEVQRHYRDRTSTIRMPRRLQALQASVLRTGDELLQGTGRAPRPSEIAARIGVPTTDVVETLEAIHRSFCASLDEPMADSDGDRPRFGEALEVHDNDLALVVDRESLGPLLAELPDREQRIVLLRFYGNLTQSQIADRCGISQMHVSRLLSTSLARLRQGMLDDAS